MGNERLVGICLGALDEAKNTFDSLGESGRESLIKPGEPLTKSDLAISQTLKNYFLNSNLSAIYCSEEAGVINKHPNPAYEVFWDELDGTFNYERGGIFPSSIVITAFEHSPQLRFKDSLFGAVFDLKTSDLWYARKGKSCFFNRRRTKTSETDNLGERVYSLIDHGPCPKKEELERFVGIYENTWPHNVSSAGIHLAMIASGHADVYVSPRQKSHELGAGYRLIKEAGGVVIDFNGNPLGQQEFDFNKTYEIIAAGTQELAEKVRTKIK